MVLDYVIVNHYIIAQTNIPTADGSDEAVSEFLFEYLL